MEIYNTTLAELEMVYLVRPIELDGGTHFLAATEQHGACLLFSPPNWRQSVVWDGPGGSVSLAPMPRRTGAFLAIQGFFPIFQCDDAGIVYAQAGNDPRRQWDVRRVLDLPFVHRIEVVDVAGVPHLVAATICGGKEFIEDWSKPGAVYAGPIPDDPTGQWALTPILNGIAKNHGMHVTELHGRPVVLIAGEEGLFAISVPEAPDGAWENQHLSDRPISDICAADVDGDGAVEIATIEPFHGNRLVLYKLTPAGLQPVCERPLDFGHVVWCGRIQGRPAILAGSREGEKDLTLFRLRPGDPPALEPTVLDRGTGPTQVAVVNAGRSDLIVTANHGAGKVDLYEILP